MPTVSVIIPTYNRACFLCETLESVLAQTYQDFEILVVDDGSTDDTEAVLAPYMSRIRYFKQENAGPAIARNRGIFYSKGEYVAFLDSDDLWYAEKLEKQVKILDENPEIGVVYTDCYCGQSPTDPNQTGFFASAYPPSGDIFERMTQNNLFWTSSLMLRKEVFITSGIFDPTLRWSEDYDLWLRICRLTKCHFIQEVLGLFREHPGRITKNLRLAEHQCRAYEIQLIRWQDNPVALKRFRQAAVERYSNTSRQFRETGRYDDAIRCLRKAVRYEKSGWRNWTILFLLRCFPFIFRWYDSRKTAGEA